VDVGIETSKRLVLQLFYKARHALEDWLASPGTLARGEKFATRPDDAGCRFNGVLARPKSVVWITSSAARRRRARHAGLDGTP